MELKIGGNYTTFEISDFMASTVQRQIVIKEIVNGEYIFAAKGKRKKYYVNTGKKIAYFEGHDLPFKADSETSSFTGNACYNLIGDVAVIKDYFDNKQLNETFEEKYMVVAIDRTGQDGFPVKSIDTQKNTVVYPELAEGKGHAILDRFLAEDKQTVEELFSILGERK